MKTSINPMNSPASLILVKFARGRIIGLALFALQLAGGCDLPVIDPTNPKPISSFTYQVEQPECTANCTVFFTNQSQNATAYEWDFGDGTTPSTEVSPIHAYASPGNYNVTLTSFNEATEHDTTIVVTFQPSTTGDPTACFTVTNNNCTAPCTITFANCSVSSDTYAWNFGDGSPVDATANPSHEYTAAGTYDVTLTATNSSGSDDITASVTILQPETVAVALTHTTTAGNINNHMTTIDSEFSNDQPGKVIIVTPVLGVRNDSPLGVYYYNKQWLIFNQDLNAIAPNEMFNVLISDPDDRAFTHQTTAGNIRSGYITTIDHPSTNNNPNARVFVTPIWKVTTDYNAHPVGVVYVNNKWEIMNLDKGAMPEGLVFNVFVDDSDQESFVHQALSVNIIGDYTTIDDPRTNAKPSVRLFVSRNMGTSADPVSNPEVLGIWYRSSQSKWTIFDETGNTMFQGVKFNVLVVE